MKIKLYQCLMLAMFAVANPAIAANKCVGSDGGVTYQEAACPGGPVQRTLPPAQPQITRQTAAKDVMTPEEIMAAVEAQRQIDAERKATQPQRKEPEPARVRIGMREEEVLASWGKPGSVNKTMTASVTSEQWVYRNGTFRTHYVYLRNGIVTSIQTTEY